jgi:hypothetical protein
VVSNFPAPARTFLWSSLSNVLEIVIIINITSVELALQILANYSKKPVIGLAKTIIKPSERKTESRTQVAVFALEAFTHVQ